MRVVIDTNVLLSGLLWNGAPHVLFGLVANETIDLVMSRELLDEFAEVIERKKFINILERTQRTPAKVLRELYVLAEVVIAPALPQPVCRDLDDDAVLACALAAQADFIVSGDDDLLTLQVFEGIPILTAVQALQRIQLQH